MKHKNVTASGIIEKITGTQLLLRAKVTPKRDVHLSIEAPEQDGSIEIGDKVIVYTSHENMGKPTMKATRLVRVAPNVWLAATI